MRFALIGHTGHWTTYQPILTAVPEARLVAVAPATKEEWPGAFDHAPGLTMDTNRYDSPEALLAAETPDFVQVCCRPDRGPRYTMECLKRGIPVVAEKPLAVDLDTLGRLWEASEKVPLAPMHSMRSEAWLAAAKQAVASGDIGKPLVSYHQKSYKWGKTRPEYYRSRRTFPGIAPWVGIHAFDWLVWLLGGEWEGIAGWESTAAHPDFPACEAQAGFVLKASGGSIATVSLDYLRPESAPTHGDERLRIAGTEGVLELGPAVQLNQLLRRDRAPESLLLPEPEDWYVRFVRSLRGQGSSLIPRVEAFRATEIALLAQRAAESEKPQRLAGTDYRL
jgi:predicted dehydrogenase